MEEPKVHIKHVMLWEFKNNKDATETAQKNSSVHGQGIITDRYARNWFSMFCSGDTLLRDELKAEHL